VKNFKKLLVKYLDSNGNEKLEPSEILYPLALFFVIDIMAGTISNLFYDFMKGILK
jgi:hypothetical protein